MALRFFRSKVTLVAVSAASLIGSVLGVNAGPLSEPMIDKDIVEKPGQDSWLHGSVTVGYQTDYLFRGNNETPGAPGVSTEDVRLSATFLGGRFELDLFGVQQLGQGAYTAFYPVGPRDNPAYPANLPPSTVKDQFIQRSYEKYIPSFQYTRTLGPVDLTLGNLVELETLSRDRATIGNLNSLTYFGPKSSTTLYQVIDRPYVQVAVPNEVSTLVPALTSFHLVPSLSYYITASETKNDLAPTGIDVGYLTARLNSSYELLPDRLILAPYGVVAVNFRDRARIGNTGFNTDYFTGFHVFQTGLEVITKINRSLDFTVQGSYVRLFDLSPTDQQNTFFGVTKVTVHF